MLVTRRLLSVSRCRGSGFILTRQLRVSTKTWNCQKVEKTYAIKSAAETCAKFKEPPKVLEPVKPKNEKFSILEKVKSMEFKEISKATGDKLNRIRENAMNNAKEQLEQMKPKETLALMRTQNSSTNLKLMKEKILDLLTSVRWNDVPGKLKHGAVVTVKFSKDVWVVGNHYFRIFLNSKEYEIMKEQSVKFSIFAYNFSKRQLKKLRAFVKDAYMDKNQKKKCN